MLELRPSSFPRRQVLSRVRSPGTIGRAHVRHATLHHPRGVHAEARPILSGDGQPGEGTRAPQHRRIHVSGDGHGISAGADRGRDEGTHLVLCPRCRFNNRGSISFCEECGARLDLACPSCGAAVPPGRKFCGSCGKALAPTAEPESRFTSPEAYTPRHLIERILSSKSAL